MMNSESPLGFAHFLAQADSVAKTILLLMLVMSVMTWYVILTKGLRNVFAHRKSQAFLKSFATSTSLSTFAAHLREKGGDPTLASEPFSAMVTEGLQAVERYRTTGTAAMIDAGSINEFVMRAIRRSIDKTAANLESGLSVLASVGASAPFVGLFGTVWGIYHALIAIGMSGQGTLDKVAGPVGEALIMTAIGLAVAIPAVLAYNYFVRQNRILLAALDDTAHEFFAFMATGQRPPAVNSGAAHAVSVMPSQAA